MHGPSPTPWVQAEVESHPRGRIARPGVGEDGHRTECLRAMAGSQGVLGPPASLLSSIRLLQLA